MSNFCPDGYLPSRGAVFTAAKCWFPENIALLEAIASKQTNPEVVSLISYPQPELRQAFEDIEDIAGQRLRNFLHHGKLKAYYFTEDGCHSVLREFWATPQADRAIESGTYWPFGRPTRWYDRRLNYPILVKQSELDALLVGEAAEKSAVSSGKKIGACSGLSPS